jgi:pyruvate dehydrogenase E1 component
VPTDVYSVPSFNELRREAIATDRYNLLHPNETPKVPYVKQLFKDRDGPIVAATDYMRTVPDQIREWIKGRYITLGTDGFGRSDSRAQLRKHFEVDRNHIAWAALRALADEGKVDKATVAKAMRDLQIDATKPDPWKI